MNLVTNGHLVHSPPGGRLLPNGSQGISFLQATPSSVKSHFRQAVPPWLQGTSKSNCIYYGCTTVQPPIMAALLYSYRLWLHYCTATYYGCATVQSSIMAPLLYSHLLWLHYCTVTYYGCTTVQSPMAALLYSHLLWQHYCTVTYGSTTGNATKHYFRLLLPSPIRT